VARAMEACRVRHSTLVKPDEGFVVWGRPMLGAKPWPGGCELPRCSSRRLKISYSAAITSATKVLQCCDPFCCWGPGRVDFTPSLR